MRNIVKGQKQFLKGSYSYKLRTFIALINFTNWSLLSSNPRRSINAMIDPILSLPRLKFLNGLSPDNKFGKPSFWLSFCISSLGTEKKIEQNYCYTNPSYQIRTHRDFLVPKYNLLVTLII